MKKLSKITLGTAQLGMNYGIANITGKPDFNSAIEILKFAWKNGINSFDTAPAYGNSEKIIGSFISSLNKEEIKKPVIVSKLPAINIEKNLTFDKIYSFINKNITLSLKNLKINRIPIYLLHLPSDLYIEDGIIIDCLNQVKSEGLIERFGLSVYNPEDVENSLKFKEINAIQVPINLFDNCLIKMGLLKKLKQNGYIIFARSIYLQGLFFIRPENLPNRLEIAKKYLIKLRKLLKDIEFNIGKLAFLYVRDLPEITSLVIGSENIGQIAENIKLLKEKRLSDDIYQKINEEFNDIPERITNPSLWDK